MGNFSLSDDLGVDIVNKRQESYTTASYIGNGTFLFNITRGKWNKGWLKLHHPIFIKLWLLQLYFCHYINLGDTLENSRVIIYYTVVFLNLELYRQKSLD